MDVFSLMFVCAVTVLACYLVASHTIKRRNKLFEEAWTSNDDMAIAKASAYGKTQFIVTLIIGAIAAGTLFVLTLGLVFGGITKFAIN